jgi:hypothetical protein
LVVWGLAPHEIHSLVGCSSAIADFVNNPVHRKTEAVACILKER